MNGLVLRDYILEGLGQNPVEYAQTYYLNYPKIAPGMWPPLFHVVLGLLLLAGQSPQYTALLLVGAATAWTTFRLWSIGKRLTGSFVASILATLFLVTPAVVDMTSAVMLDGVIAALALEATYRLAIYFTFERNKDAVLFGVLAAMCCLTKGNGLAIIIAPILLVLLTRRFRLLLRPGLYVSALIVVLVALPLLLYSYRLDAAIGDFGPVTRDVVLARLRFYGIHFSRDLGVFAMLLGSVGILGGLGRPRNDGDLRSTLPAALTALVMAALLFHLLNPHVVVAERYMTLAIAPMLALAGLAAVRLAHLARTTNRQRALRVALLVLVVTGTIATRPATATRLQLGFRDAVAMLQSVGGLAGQRILVISNETGEGAFVSEVAVTAPSPRATVVRGSKLLASDDWNGHHLHLEFSSSAALMQELEDLHVSYVVADASPGGLSLPYGGLVREFLTKENERIEPIYAAVGVRRIVVYRLKHQSDGPAKKLRIKVSSNLQGSVEER